MELSCDNEVGRIVWVRRKNGSWWPGKILGGEELSASDLMSPRPGTPIKYLGRNDASVDWFNLEKSKRVKPFRCSEFDDCIQRAQASQGMRPKKQQKYASRLDAILDALQLEKQFLHKKYPNLQTPVPLNCQPSNNHNDDDDIYDADQIEFVPKVFGSSETGEDESMSDADESDQSLPPVSKWQLKGKRNTRSLMKDTSASESVSVTVGQLPSELGTILTDSEVDATTIDELQEKPGTTLPKTIIDFAVQCHTCRKWRKLETEEHFEEFRSKHTKDRFNCNKLPGTTCEDTTNIMNYDSSRVWAMDKPNIPKTPQGFKRIVSLRNDCSKLDVQYLTPQKKKIRSGVEMAFFLDKHPEFKDLSPSDFCFMAPKLTPDTVPKIVVQDQASDTVPNIA